MVSIEVEYGYGNSAKGGRDLPLTVTVKNGGSEALQGTLEILTRQSDGDIYAYEYPVETGASSSETAHYVIPLGVGSDQLRVALRDAAGELLAEQQVQLKINAATPELFVGLLSDHAEKLSYLSEVSVNYGQLRTQTFEFTADSFPSDRRQLSAMDVILISDYKIAQLDVEQLRGLMQWMREGGVLMLGTGARVDDTLGLFAPEFLDDMYEAPRETTINMGDLEGTETAGGSEVTLPIAGFSLHGGSVVLAAQAEPLLTAANKGKGVLAVASFDFPDMAEYAISNNSFADMLLTRALGRARLDRLASEAYGTEYDEYWSAQALVDSGAKGLLPNPGLYGGILFLYLLASGPLLYLFLKKRALSVAYRRAAAGMALCFAALIFALSGKTRFNDTFYSYASVREAGEDTVNETTYLNLRNPYSAPYQVQVKAGGELAPLTTALNREWLQPVTGEEQPNVTISERGDVRKIAVRNVGAFRSRFFRIGQSRENTERVGFSGELFLFGDDCSGKITNNFPFAVRSAAVILYGKIIPLGDMESGETVEVGERTLYRIPLNDSDTVAAFLSGVYDGTAGRDSHLRALERANFLSFYLTDSAFAYSADARIVAFSAETEEDKPVLDRGLRSSGMTIVTSVVPVNSRRGELICRSGLIRTPEVLSGDYISGTNSYYRGDPVVLGYFLGTGLRIRQLTIEEPDTLFENPDGRPDSHSFRGTISFYNYESGNFDDVEAGKRVFSAQELRYYLSPDNMITVRYAEEVDGAGGRPDAALPLLTVIGEES